MAQTTSLIITVVFGAAILYLLSRIRHLESQFKRLKQDNTEQASVQDCYEIAAQVLDERQKKMMNARAQMQQQQQQAMARARKQQQQQQEEEKKRQAAASEIGVKYKKMKILNTYALIQMVI